MSSLIDCLDALDAGTQILKDELGFQGVELASAYFSLPDNQAHVVCRSLPQLHNFQENQVIKYGAYVAACIELYGGQKE